MNAATYTDHSVLAIVLDEPNHIESKSGTKGIELALHPMTGSAQPPKVVWLSEKDDRAKARSAKLAKQVEALEPGQRVMARWTVREQEGIVNGKVVRQVGTFLDGVFPFPA